MTFWLVDLGTCVVLNLELLCPLLISLILVLKLRIFTLSISPNLPNHNPLNDLGALATVLPVWKTGYRLWRCSLYRISRHHFVQARNMWAPHELGQRLIRTLQNWMTSVIYHGQPVILFPWLGRLSKFLLLLFPFRHHFFLLFDLWIAWQSWNFRLGFNSLHSLCQAYVTFPWVP